MNSISPNLNLMIKSCEKVSKVLIRDFGEVEKLQVSIKGPNNFVTNSDRKAEDMLINELSKSKKKYSFLTEESGFIKNEDKENFWVIDPIDGTTNFINGIPHFCISVGLVLDNEVVSGVIYDPIKDEIYYAEKKSGAYMNNKSIRVSRKKEISLDTPPKLTDHTHTPRNDSIHTPSLEFSRRPLRGAVCHLLLFYSAALPPQRCLCNVASAAAGPLEKAFT